MRKWKNEGTSLEWKMRLSECEGLTDFSYAEREHLRRSQKWRNERMKMGDSVATNMGTQRKITRAVRTKYYALQDWNDMRTVRP